MPLHQPCTRMSLALIAALAATGCSLSSPTLQDTRELELAVDPGSRFVIDAGAGSLSLQGDAQSSAIHVSAEIYQVEPNEDYTLALESDDTGGARLESHADSGGFGNNDRIDLSIRIPRSLLIRLNDGSGSVTINDLGGDIDIEDGSGSISIGNVSADVTIDDGSGSLLVETAGGNVRIDDGSGSITLRDITGDIDIDDGSGSITVNNAGGVVTVADGSGSITINGAHDFELLDDGSGSVNLENIRRQESGPD